MAKAKLQEIKITDIVLSGDNPRIINEKSASFIELVESVSAKGVVVPVHVRIHSHVASSITYELLAGERRLRAAAKANRKTIPAIYHGLISNEEAFEITFTENFAREDLTPLEQGKAVETLMRKYKGDTQAVASKLGKSTKWVLQRKAINNNLSKEWKQAIVEENEYYKFYTAAHLQLIAALPAKIQNWLLEQLDPGQWEMPTVKELEKTIADMMRLLSKAPFDLNDGSFADAPACSKCEKRTSCSPGLFDDVLDIEAIEKTDRCLNTDCWNRKLREYILKTAEENKAVFAAKDAEKLEYHERELISRTYGDVITEFTKSKEGAKGAIKAVICHGPNAGEVQFIKPKVTITASGKERKTDATGKAEKKPMAERIKELNNKRWCAVLRAMQVKIENASAEQIVYEYKEIVVAALAGIFGTIGNQDNCRYCNNPAAWGDFAKVITEAEKTNGDAVAMTTAKLFEQVKPVLIKRLNYCDAITRLPEEYVLEAKQIALQFGIDIDALFAEQVTAIPEPKSWAAEKQNKKGR